MEVPWKSGGIHGLPFNRPGADRDSSLGFVKVVQEEAKQVEMHRQYRKVGCDQRR